MHPHPKRQRPVASTSAESRTRRLFYSLATGFTLGHSIHLGTLIATLSMASGGLGLAVWAFFIQQIIEPLTELATGSFADRNGRKPSVVIGFGLLTISGILFVLTTAYLMNREYWAYTLVFCAQLCYLAGNAYISGALEAWAVDSLNREEHQPPILTNLFATLALYKNSAVMLGGGVGILSLLLFGVAWAPWLSFTLLMGTLTLTAALLMREYHTPARISTPLFADIALSIGEILGTLRRSRELRPYIFGWALQYGLWVVLAYFWIKILLIGTNSLSNQWFWAGFAWVCWCLMRILAAAATERILIAWPKAGDRVLIISAFCSVIPIWLYILFGFQSGDVIGLVPFLVAVVVSKGFEVAVTPLRMARLNRGIPDSGLRASYLSFASGLGALWAYILICLYLIIYWSWPETIVDIHRLIVLGAVSATVGAAFYLWPSGNSTP